MKKVYVGLSGGVDSSVAAYLLQKQGYDVTGVFIKIWSPEFLECTWREDRLDAMRVCVALGIPYLEIDLSKEYRAEVVDEMIAQYTRGATPNPDVLCNERIKFGHFAQWAFSNGADYVATGHYARLRISEHGVQLLKAVDAAKDQSYFLCRVGSEVLARTLFPIGDYQKSRIREIAREAQLPVAQKPDSQGLCFVGEVTMKEFLGRFIRLEAGVVEDLHGTAIGTHEGAALYTPGQRHGFEIRGDVGHAPHYVVGIDTARNVIRVSTNRTDAAVRSARLSHCVWIDSPPALPQEYEVQTRYHEAPVRAMVYSDRVEFADAHIAAPGQSLVMYRNDVCVGSAIICA